MSRRALWESVAEFQQRTQRGIKTNGFQNAKFLIYKRGILVPVCFGTCLGVSLPAPKGYLKRDGHQKLERQPLACFRQAHCLTI